MSRWAYQTSRFFIPAKPAIAVRYAPTVSSTIRSCSSPRKPLSRAAINMLAANRLTSHSHGPGSVSSKSLTSNTSRRSGEANTPKFDRCASPQHCTVSPDRGVAARSLGHDHRRPAIERKRRDQHPPVANRHQLRHARLRLALEQLDRIGPSRQRLEHGMTAARHLISRRLAPRDALSHRQMRHRCPAFRPARRRAATVVGRLGPRRHRLRLPLDRHRR